MHFQELLSQSWSLLGLPRQLRWRAISNSRGDQLSNHWTDLRLRRHHVFDLPIHFWCLVEQFVCSSTKCAPCQSTFLHQTIESVWSMLVCIEMSRSLASSHRPQMLQCLSIRSMSTDHSEWMSSGFDFHSGWSIPLRSSVLCLWEKSIQCWRWAAKLSAFIHLL